MDKIAKIPESYIKKYVEGNGRETIVRLEMENTEKGNCCDIKPKGDTRACINCDPYTGGCTTAFEPKLTGNEVIVVEDLTEMEKCMKSPYYFYTTYCRVNGKTPTTHLSEEEFNKQWEHYENPVKT